MLGQLPFDAGHAICLRWSHSVTGGAVADCFENRSGTMVLTRSYLHDFAAGLGEVAGRGQLQPSAGGGYWITGIDEVIPGNALALRVGPMAVNHTLSGGGQSLSLSQIAADTPVVLRLKPDRP